MLNIIKYERNANRNHNEVLLHTSQNRHHRKLYKQQMLERVCREGNLLVLLVEKSIDIVTMEKSMAVL